VPENIQTALLAFFLGASPYLVNLGVAWLSKRGGAEAAAVAARSAVETARIEAETSREEHRLKAETAAFEYVKEALRLCEQRNAALVAELHEQEREAAKELRERERELETQRDEARARERDALQDAFNVRSQAQSQVLRVRYDAELRLAGLADVEAARDTALRRVTELLAENANLEHANRRLREQLPGETTGDRWPAEEG
jgi:hypothetical protein